MAIKFLKYLGLLLFVVFIADRVLFVAINRVQLSTLRGIQGGKINHYLSLPVTPNILIMGPSNAGYQIHPSSFETDTYNLGHPDTEDAFQTALLSIIIQSKKSPRNILLHVTPDTYLGEDSLLDYISKSPLKLGFYYSKNQLTTTYINEIGIKERIKFLMLLTQYNNKIISLFKDFAGTKLKGPVEKGFFAFTASARDSINVTKDYATVVAKRQQIAGKEKTLFVQKSKMKYLNKFIELCRENNINLILFTLPFYPDVVERRELDLAYNNITSFARSNNVKYFDFRQTDLSVGINRPSYWKDMQHLNENGSLYESKYVSEMVGPHLVK